MVATQKEPARWSQGNRKSVGILYVKWDFSISLNGVFRTEKLTAERRAAEAEIQERLRKFQIVDPELLVIDDFEDVIEEPEFIELTPDHRARINAALHGPLDQVNTELNRWLTHWK